MSMYDRIKTMTAEEMRHFIYWVYMCGNEMKTRITFSSFGKNNKRGRKPLFLFVEMPNLI